MKRPLTQKQKAFVEVFDGNATEAAKRAGYEGSDKTLSQIGYENMNRLEIRSEIEQRQLVKLEPMIADRQKRQEWWSQVMNDENIPLRDRLKASELLAKTDGDFFARTIQTDDDLAILNRMIAKNRLKLNKGPV